MSIAKRTTAMVVMILTALAMCLVAFATPTMAKCSKAGNGGNKSYIYCDDNYSSGLLIVGDSRIHGMAVAKSHKGASYGCVVGGHYYHQKAWGNEWYINSSSRVTWMKSTIKKTIQKKGSCKVVLESTVNDVNVVGNKNSRKAIESLANTLYGVTAKYKGKTVHPKVYVTECLKTTTKSFGSYNSDLKADAKKSGKFSYMNLPNPSKGDFKDSTHFNNAFSKKLFNAMK